MSELKRIYEQIADTIIAQINGGELVVGDKLPSENALAAKFFVSRGSVVKALALLENKGYISAGEKGKRRTVKAIGGREIERTAYRIALLVPRHKEYFLPMIAEFERCCRSSGYVYTLIEDIAHTGQIEIFNRLLKEKYDGAIFMQNVGEGMEYNSPYDLLQKHKLPFVILCKPHNRLQCNAVYYDDYFASYQLVDELYARHCWQVVFITDSVHYNSSVEAERRRGFLDRVSRYPNVQPQIFDIAKAGEKKRFQEFLVANPYKIGLFCYNNGLFHEILPFLQAGKCRIGYGYEAISFYEEKFSNDTATQLVFIPKEKIVRKSVQILANIIRNPQNESVRQEVFVYQKPKRK